jgi:hypothetical protein
LAGAGAGAATEAAAGAGAAGASAFLPQAPSKKPAALMLATCNTRCKNKRVVMDVMAMA